MRKPANNYDDFIKTVPLITLLQAGEFPRHGP